MSAEVYYFSGTGNSLAVARDLADQLNAKLISVTSVLGKDSIASEADVIGFVFPIYDFKPPQPMEHFISQLKDIDSKYLFAVCTYGITPSRSLYYLDKLLRTHGGHLSAGFAVAMPHNGVGCGAVTTQQHERMFKAWKSKRQEICDYIQARKTGTIESSNMLFGFFQPGIIKVVPSAIKLLTQMLLWGVESLAFTPSNDCDGCGTCERICPGSNIKIAGGKPAWSTHCAGCFACLHWCPKRAISLGGHDMGIKQYHHPDVTISEMMNNK